MKTAALAFRIPADLKESLQRLADADDRSLSNYVERALRQHVEEREAAAATAARKKPPGR